MSNKFESKRLDLFCWKCHKTETNMSCGKCQRSFHIKCISMTKSLKDFAPNWVCNECVNTSGDVNCPLDSIQLQQIMLLSLKMVSKSADYYFNSEKCFADKRIKVDSILIVNPINLKKIEEKINDFELRSFRELTAQFKWILHNCIVGQLESGLIENAKFLLSKAKSEEKDFEECVDCFINYYKTSKAKYYSWFSKPCKQMHPLVWAKLKGHPFWPSKVIKANPNSKTNSVLVRFFGTQQKSWVKEKDCFLISEEVLVPLKGKALEMEKLFNSALEEMRHNIKYLNEEHPNWFQFSPKFTPFSIEIMNQNNANHSKTKPKVVNNNNNSKDNQLLNRPNGWRPKARKSFPVPTTTAHQLEIKPIEISSNNNKKFKTNANIEIIEFNSERLPIKREMSPSLISIDKRIKTEFTQNIKEDKTEPKNTFENFEYISQQKNIKISNLEPLLTEVKSNINSNEDIIGGEVETDITTTKTDSVLTESKTIKYLELKVKNLEKTIEIKDNNYKKQIMETQSKSDLAVEQIRRSLESDKQKAVIEERNKQIAINSNKLEEMKANFKTEMNQLIARHKLEIKSLEDKFGKELRESKTKIWCFSCLKEAQLYCCSHTYYCSNECQLNHWENHKQICTQK